MDRSQIFFPNPISLRRYGGRLGALALVLCNFFSLYAMSQDKSEAVPVTPANSVSSTAKLPEVSKEALVWDRIHTKIREEADGTDTRMTTARVHILADAGVKEMAVLTFTYTASNQQIDFGYVRVIKPDGSVVTTPDYNIQDMSADVTRTAPMYSDIHQKHVAVKGLGVGDTLEYEVTLRTLKADIPGHFWLEYSFEKNLVVLDEQLDLDLPADKFVTIANADVQPTTMVQGNRKLYHWTSSNLVRPDPDAPPKSTKHKKPSVQVTTFRSWEEVGAWYQSLQQDSVQVTPAIQAKAAALTKGLTSDDEKIRAIFNEVALHTHYVGLNFGIGRYKPHAADDVLSNEYGDCKDKHTLLAALLKAAGIEAWPVLISSSRELDPATPSPAQFDHVITVVPQGNKLLWMDSTAEVAPVGVLFASLRDKQALAIPAQTPSHLERTPADLPSPRTIRFQIDGALTEQGIFKGTIEETTNGDVGTSMRAVFRRVSQSQWKELMSKIARSLSFGGEVSNPQASDVEQIESPFRISFDYVREKYYKWDDNETSHWVGMPMPPMGGELSPGIKQVKPADDVELGYTGDTDYRAVMQLPVGWSMVPPKSIDINLDWVEYHSRYSFQNGVVTAERHMIVKKNVVPLDKWDEYISFRKSIGEELNTQFLIFPPKSHKHHLL
jgi:hypothetical protein